MTDPNAELSTQLYLISPLDVSGEFPQRLERARDQVRGERELDRGADAHSEAHRLEGHRASAPSLRRT